MYSRVVASAPGKITLFGEHAVVYGKPAIVTAISRRVTVSVRKASPGVLVVSSSNLTARGIEMRASGDRVEYRLRDPNAPRLLSYVLTALKVAEEELGVHGEGLEIEVSSDMPVSAGLGTSASVSVAIIAAYMRLLGHDPEPRIVARLGHAVERRVQGAASPMDTAASSLGGTLLVEPWNKPPYREIPVDVSRLHVVIGYIPRSSTTGELVARVREARAQHRRLFDTIMEAIGELTREAVDAMLSYDIDALGLLMNINHELLSALGVSTSRLDGLVNLARDTGALGAKLTGAGGGGAFIALCRSSGDVLHVSRSLRAGGASVIEASLGAPGVRIEQVEK